MIRRLHGLGTAAILAIAAVLGLLPGTAAAHVEVAPAVVAPSDSVRFTVLVPGERDPARTTQVELKVPAGVIPYAYGETPGWTRRAIAGADGGVERIVWTGSLPGDGFVELSFLAGTPDAPGLLVWKALQTYDDGTVVRWIDGPDGDLPAATTRVDAAAQRAGDGDGGAVPPTATTSAAPAAAATEAEAARTVSAAVAAAAVSSPRDVAAEVDRTARWLAIAALAVAVAAAALGVALRARRGVED